MPKESRNCLFEIGIPTNIHSHTMIIALYDVFIKIRIYLIWPAF